MALVLPSRDDRTFDQLVEVLRRQLPPEEWTDHNASDPGITVLELLCWLGEMVSYRMDRVPSAHREKFLNFLIDPPEPVTVELQFTADFQVAPATAEITIPAGTLLATDFVNGRRFVFETFQPLTLTRPDPPASPTAQGILEARAILTVINEPLGISDGRPHQTFQLRPPRIALGVDSDVPLPVLLDFVHETYEPNPQIAVSGDVDIWHAVPSLLTEASRLPTSTGKQFLVQPYESIVRFGDNTFGAIPPAGSIITCARYAVLDGPAGLSVRENEVRHLLNFAPPADVLLGIENADAEGGANFFSISRRFEEGLAEVLAPYRLITTSDFERAVLEDFNEFQRLAGRTPEVLRASAVFNRRPPLDDDLEEPGNVTLLLVAGDPDTFDDDFRNETISVGDKQNLITVSDALWERIRRFLEPRRLITTRLHRHTPELVPLTLTATVVALADRNTDDVLGRLHDRIYDFLSPLIGDFDGRGWRLGRSVYRSQVFRLLEDADDVVDHVESLTLSPADAQGNVIIGPHQLPVLQTLTLTILRGTA